jgi:uncharacterized protein (DUF433 family)
VSIVGLFRESSFSGEGEMEMTDSMIERAEWRQHIVSTPEVLSGKPRINGTRIPVVLILGYLAAGNTNDDIIKEFPDLKREHIVACLDYARQLAEYKIV